MRWHRSRRTRSAGCGGPFKDPKASTRERRIALFQLRLALTRPEAEQLTKATEAANPYTLGYRREAFDSGAEQAVLDARGDIGTKADEFLAQARRRPAIERAFESTFGIAQAERRAAAARGDPRRAEAQLEGPPGRNRPLCGHRNQGWCHVCGGPVTVQGQTRAAEHMRPGSCRSRAGASHGAAVPVQALAAGTAGSSAPTRSWWTAQLCAEHESSCQSSMLIPRRRTAASTAGSVRAVGP